jgi:hypothetical protein
VLAQHIDGRVLSARDSTPIPSALVQLRDGAGVSVSRAATDASGAFRLGAPAPGRYRVAVLRIGQHPWLSPVVDLLSGGADQPLTLVPPDDPVVLAAITVEGSTTCRAAPGNQSLVGALLAEAEKALTLTKLAMESGGNGYIVQRWERTLTRGFTLIDSTGELDVGMSWPIRTVPADSLARHGFVYEEGPSPAFPSGHTAWIGPDAATLFSPWFLETHCFSVSRGTDDQDALEVAFEPTPGRRRSDIEGTLVIRRHTLELQRIEWRFVRLPSWVDRRGAGGEMTFQRLPSDVYLPNRWWMRAPMPGTTASGGRWSFTRVTVGGWHEIGGELVERP